MIRLFFRTVSINLLGIYLASQILSGIIVYVGGAQTLLMAALVIAGVNLFVRPIINLLLLPINLITLGMFRWVSNLVTLFLVTRLISNLQIRPFDYAGANLGFLSFHLFTFQLLWPSWSPLSLSLSPFIFYIGCFRIKEL